MSDVDTFEELWKVEGDPPPRVPDPPQANVAINQAGWYPDLSAEDYHRDPVVGGSLSSSGARALLPPSCPARFRWDQDHGQAPRRTFDLGHAAHRLVLGRGAELETVDATDWRTKAAKEKRDAAREAGRVPLLTHEMATVEAMAEQLRKHPVAARLLAEDDGAAEQTVVWQDQATGVWCRARYDWLPNPQAGRRLVLVDYKTAASTELEALKRAMHQFGYHQQAAWYLQGATEVFGVADPGFVFIAQERTPPYLVTVFTPDVVALRIGAERNHVARCVYARCTETGYWPAYDDGLALLPLPAWAERQEGTP